MSCDMVIYKSGFAKKGLSGEMDGLIEKKEHGLNSNQIKLIAIVAMTIDHIVWLLFPGCQHIWWVWCLHIAGRITAPIMWFFIAEGF